MNDLEQTAIERLKTASGFSLRLYKVPLLITYSGGKDSDVLLRLAEKSGIPFDVLHSLTTADAPETVYHVRDTFRRLEEKGIRCDVDKHILPDGTRTTMWNLIPRKLLPPTRFMRYCCSELKECGGKERFIATGVRWEESAKRKDRGVLEVLHSDKSKRLTLMNDNDDSRMMMENCQLNGKRVVNPIIDWTDADVLGYAESEKIPMNPLYACGWKRVGCIGCPLAGKKARGREFALYPKYRDAYVRAFDRMVAERIKRGLEVTWRNGAEVLHWWMEDGVLPGQITMDDMEDL